jgi:putative transcriptional regulator
MSVAHHPSEAILLDYAAGGLGEGLALVVALHLTFCPSCRSGVAEAEAVGGALLEALPPAELAEDALQRTLHRLDERPPPALPRPPMVAEGGLALPRPLAERLGPLRESRWRPMSPGVEHVEVLPPTAAGGHTVLLRSAPGAALPRHGHTGRELTVVLAGSFVDELGRFAAGDLAEIDDEREHRPVIDSAEPCVSVVATEGRLRRPAR